MRMNTDFLMCGAGTFSLVLFPWGKSPVLRTNSVFANSLCQVETNNVVGYPISGSHYSLNQAAYIIEGPLCSIIPYNFPTALLLNSQRPSDTFFWKPYIFPPQALTIWRSRIEAQPPSADVITALAVTVLDGVVFELVRLWKKPRATCYLKG